VYFESFSDIEQAIRREKLIKEYSRDKKNQLVNNVNPEWKDLTHIAAIAPVDNFFATPNRP
jgi:putative endonuclease